MKKTTLFFLFFLIKISGYAQQNVFGVNQVTGSATAVIPIYNITRGTVNLPVSLVYGYSGLKPTDIEGSAGMSWDVQVGGKISRQVNGLPDDCKKDFAGNARLGWLYNSNGTKISNFNIANTSTLNCTNEAADINYINSNFADLSDTEPDIFTVDAPGLSCQLVFDENHIIHPISYQDIVVTATYNTTTTDQFYGAITGFTIVNDQGITYVFSVPERVNQTTSLATLKLGTGTATYFANRYNQYKNGIQYYADWRLKSITDVNGNGVVLNYQSQAIKHSEDDIVFYAGNTGTTTTKIRQYAVLLDVTPQQLQSVQTNDHGVLTQILSFSGTSNSSTRQFCIESISGLGKTYKLGYTSVTSTESSSSYSRSFLTSFKAEGCNSSLKYTFEYNGVSAPDPFLGNSTIALGDSSSFHTDFWGYYSANGFTDPVPSLFVNPVNTSYQRYVIKASTSVGLDYTYTLSANDKIVDPVNVTVGALNKIIYGDGGYTSILYEPNDYLDVPSNLTVRGGGVRVKQVTDFGGINAANNIVTNYTYQANGKSSGKPTSLPVFGFTTPYTGTQTGTSYWNYSTIRSASDLSNEDHTILYSSVRMSRTGGGSTLSQFYIPATNWDITSSPACSGCSPDWSPTVDYSARTTCASYGSTRNDIDSYPFASNINYDFERGLLQKQSDYNDANQLVKETSYTYQRSATPATVTGFRYENNNGVVGYAKFKIYYASGELTSQVTDKVYDSSTLTQALTTITNNTYNNTYNKLIKQQTTNSDNSITTVNTTYSKDYTISSTSSDSTVNAIYHLQKQNINVPVENYIQVTRGGVTTTTSSQLSKFKTVQFPGNTYAYLPFQSLKMTAADGASFTPFFISAGAASYDPKYFPVKNYTSYDNSGFPQTSDDGNKNSNTVVTDHLSFHPVAIFKNAAFAEIGFNDFDSNLPAGSNFILSYPIGIGPTNSHSGNAYQLLTGQSLSKAMIKKNGANSYILSAWLSSTAAGTINITLTNSSGTTTPISKTFTNTGGASKYFEWQVPVSGMTSSFTISLGTSVTIYIDDVLFYPRDSEVETYAYDPVTYFKIAETNTNGVSTYYNLDPWGRLLFRLDQDRNIVEKRTYISTDDVTAGLFTPIIWYSPTPAMINSPANLFGSQYPCKTGITYSWNFGDGTSATVINGFNQTHTYASTGNYTVTLSTSHPIYGTSTVGSAVINVQYPPLIPMMCQSGVTIWDNCYHKSLNQESCPPNANDATHSYYSISSVGGSGYGALHYQWQLSYDNGVTWVNDGTDSNQFTKNCAPKNQKYRIRCVVTSSVGQTGTSISAFFDVQECQ